MEGKYAYIAFISYKREDKKWAQWLHRKLEHYKLPGSVRKTNAALPEKVRPIFRDITDLEPGVLSENKYYLTVSSRLRLSEISFHSNRGMYIPI